MDGDLDHGLDARLLLRAAEARRDHLGDRVPVGHDVGGHSRQGQDRQERERQHAGTPHGRDAAAGGKAKGHDDLKGPKGRTAIGNDLF